MKEPKTLPQAIKILVGRYGKNVMNDVQMVNIMSDVVSLDESLAVKNTFREILKLGYGKKILALISATGDNKLKIRIYSKGIADTHGYKEVIVQYILYSMAYGVDLCPEPYLKNIESKPTPHRLSSQKETQEYLEDGNTKKPYFYKLIIGLLVIASLGGGVYLFKYIDSSGDREKYDQKIVLGNHFLKNGDYVNAVESYKEAYDGYNALNSKSYKEAVLFRMDDLVDKLYNEGTENNNSLLQAYKVLQSEMQLNLDKDTYSRLQSKKESIEQLMSSRIVNGRNSLISSISANGGKLNKEGKKLLNELLDFSPDDYWLNFIKKKSDE